MNLQEIIESYGAIVYSNEELGLVVTVNNVYLNLWVQAGISKNGQPKWECTECSYHPDNTKGWLSMSTSAVMDAAEEWVEELIRRDTEESEMDWSNG
jgi:hypothetical protein